jgi:two-component system osmolarity sensor histidine kinase EnvZ
MEAIISQFMDYARADHGETPTITDLASLLRALSERQRHLGRALELEIADKLPAIPLCPKSLDRALSNLIDNAWKYGSSKVTLRALPTSAAIVIEVADNGPGIPEDQSERLKRPFTRLESARTNASGTGLGLAIVERIARLHGGQLTLLANHPGGLTARLTLPLSGNLRAISSP